MAAISFLNYSFPSLDGWIRPVSNTCTYMLIDKGMPIYPEIGR